MRTSAKGVHRRTVRAVQLSVEALEERALLTGGLTAQLLDGVLVVEGTEGNDIIRVRQMDNKISVDYTLIQTPDAPPVRRIAAALVTRVEVRGKGGDDFIHLISAAPDGGAALPVVVETGAGQSRLVSDTDAGRFQTGLDADSQLTISGEEVSPPTEAPPAAPPPTAPLPAEDAPLFSRDEQRFLDLFQTYRTNHGLNTLRANVELTEAATYQAEYMARTGLYAHENADGRDLGDRAHEAGYHYGWIGEALHLYDPGIRRTLGIERVYQRSEIATYYLDGWDASAPHQEILLKSNARDVGVAIAEANNGMVYAALLVAR